MPNQSPPILVSPGKQVSPKAASSFTQRGSTAHFVVFYETDLGNTGVTLADGVLTTCEGDYTALQGYFGGITPGALPFHIYIQQGSNGGWHAFCEATALTCDAYSGDNTDLVRFIVVAEADEVFMAAQHAGWNCGANNGEGLSRVLATERYPAQGARFSVGDQWLTSGRPDFVTVTDPSDNNYVSTGCATLFLNYLHSQLPYSWAQIIQAGGISLAQTYTKLTGATDAFARFLSLINTRFPTDQAPIYRTDNPFPIQLRLAFVMNKSSILELLFVSSSDGVNWSSNTDINETSSSPPALAAFGGMLYMAFRSIDSRNLLQIISSTDGMSWSGITQVNQSSQAAPSLAVFQGKLYMTFLSNDSHNLLLIISSSDGVNWSGATLVNQSSSLKPGLVGF